MPNVNRSTTQAFLLFSPVSILGFCVSFRISEVQSNLTLLLLEGIAITLVSFLIYSIAMKFEFLIPEKLQRFKLPFAVTSAVTGATRGLTFYLFVELSKWEQPSSLRDRILSSTFTTVFWLTLSNTVVNNSRQFRVYYRRNLKRLIAEQSLQNKPISQASADNLYAFENNLKKSLTPFLGTTDSEDFINLSRKITQQINDELKPLSQRLWVRSLDEYPVVRVGQLLKDSLTRINFSTPHFLIVMTALAIFENLAARSFSETLIRTGSYLILTVLAMRSLKMLLKAVRVDFSVIYLVLVSILPLVGSEAIAQGLNLQGDWLALILITPIPGVVIYVLSILKLTSSDRAYILNLLRSETKLDAISPAGQSESALASYLHNSLQSELLALSVKLNDAALHNNKEESEKLLQQVSSLVNRSIADDFSKFAESPLDRLESLKSSWQGLLEISVNIEDNLLKKTERNAKLVQLIEEVATNAYRYGGASKLIVSATGNDEGLLVSLQSNGEREVVEGSGLGSIWFDFIAAKPWKIEKNVDGTKFTIDI